MLFKQGKAAERGTYGCMTAATTALSHIRNVIRVSCNGSPLTKTREPHVSYTPWLSCAEGSTRSRRPTAVH